MAELIKEGYLEVKKGSLIVMKYKRMYVRLFRGIPMVHMPSRRRKVQDKSKTPTIQLANSEDTGEMTTIPLNSVWEVIEKQSKSSKRYAFELYYEGQVLITFSCSSVFDRDTWMSAFASLKEQPKPEAFKDVYRVSVKRSEGSAELGISGDYLLSICEKGLYLKTTNDFEVQIWEYDSIASVVESSESAKLLNVEIKKRGDSRLLFQFQMEEAALKKFMIGWKMLVFEQYKLRSQRKSLDNMESLLLDEPDECHVRSNSVTSQPSSAQSSSPFQELYRQQSVRGPSGQPAIPERSRWSMINTGPFNWPWQLSFDKTTEEREEVSQTAVADPRGGKRLMGSLYESQTAAVAKQPVAAKDKDPKFNHHDYLPIIGDEGGVAGLDPSAHPGSRTSSGDKQRNNSEEDSAIEDNSRASSLESVSKDQSNGQHHLTKHQAKGSQASHMTNGTHVSHDSHMVNSAHMSHDSHMKSSKPVGSMVTIGTQTCDQWTAVERDHQLLSVQSSSASTLKQEENLSEDSAYSNLTRSTGTVSSSTQSTHTPPPPSSPSPPPPLPPKDFLPEYFNILHAIEEAPELPPKPFLKDPIDNPVDPAVRPGEAAVRPVEPAVKPVDPAVKSVEPAVKSVEAAVKPVEAAVRPVEPTVKPVEAAVKPVEAAIKPVDPAVKLKTTQQPKSYRRVSRESYRRATSPSNAIATDSPPPVNKEKDSREGENHTYEVLLVSDNPSEQMNSGSITKPIAKETILEETEDNVCPNIEESDDELSSERQTQQSDVSNTLGEFSKVMATPSMQTKVYNGGFAVAVSSESFQQSLPCSYTSLKPGDNSSVFQMPDEYNSLHQSVAALQLLGIPSLQHLGIPLGASPLHQLGGFLLEEKENSNPLEQKETQDSLSMPPNELDQVRHTGETTPVRHTGETTPVPHTGETTPVRHTGETTPVRHTGETTPVRHTGETTPVRHTGETTPVRHTGETTPVPHTGETTPVPHTGETTPVPHTGETTPVPHTGETTPVPHTGETTPVPHTGETSVSGLLENSSALRVSSSSLDNPASSLYTNQPPLDNPASSLYTNQPPLDNPASSLYTNQPPLDNPASSLYTNQPPLDNPASSLYTNQPPLDNPASSLYTNQPPLDNPASSLYTNQPPLDNPASSLYTNQPPLDNPASSLYTNQPPLDNPASSLYTNQPPLDNPASSLYTNQPPLDNPGWHGYPPNMYPSGFSPYMWPFPPNYPAQPHAAHIAQLYMMASHGQLPGMVPPLHPVSTPTSMATPSIHPVSQTSVPGSNTLYQQGTVTPTPQGTATPTPQGMAMPTPQGTATPTPQGMATPTPQGMATPTPQGMAMPTPQGMTTPTFNFARMPSFSHPNVHPMFSGNQQFYSPNQVSQGYSYPPNSVFASPNLRLPYQSSSCPQPNNGNQPPNVPQRQVHQSLSLTQSNPLEQSNQIPTNSAWERRPHGSMRAVERQASFTSCTAAQDYLKPMEAPAVPPRVPIAQKKKLKRIAVGEKTSLPSGAPERSQSFSGRGFEDAQQTFNVFKDKVKRFDSQTSQNSDTSPHSSTRRKKSTPTCDDAMALATSPTGQDPPPVPPRSRQSLQRVDSEGLAKPDNHLTRTLDVKTVGQALAAGARHRGIPSGHQQLAFEQVRSCKMKGTGGTLLQDSPSSHTTHVGHMRY